MIDKDIEKNVIKAIRARQVDGHFCVCGKCSSCNKNISYADYIYCDECLDQYKRAIKDLTQLNGVYIPNNNLLRNSVIEERIVSLEELSDLIDKGIIKVD